MKLLLTALFAATFAACASAQTVSPALQAKLDHQFTSIESWAADPILIDAVKAHNANVPPEQAALNQDKWRALTVLDPLVRGFTKNPAAQLLKTNRTPLIAEAFLSDAAGLKVAFIAKTSNWSHKGKPKHDVPMTGKRWQGPIEVDESSGQQQIQIAVPVLDGGTPIGSLVVGISITALASAE